MHIPGNRHPDLNFSVRAGTEVCKMRKESQLGSGL